MNTFSLSFLNGFSSESLMGSWISNGTPDAMMPVSTYEPRDAPDWERLPLHVDASCELDRVLLGLIQSSQNHIYLDANPELSDQKFPSIGSLLNPENQNVQSSISHAIGRHGRVSMEVPTLLLKLGIMYNICFLLRWLISPTKRNYDALPEYMRPRGSQLTVPHPIWIDAVVWSVSLLAPQETGSLTSLSMVHHTYHYDKTFFGF